MSVRSIPRRARKALVACGDHRVRPGEYYLEFTDFPGSDLGPATYAGHPVRLRECRACAERYGRGHLFPIVSPQVDSAPCGEHARPGPSSDGDHTARPGRASSVP